MAAPAMLACLLLWTPVWAQEEFGGAAEEGELSQEEREAEHAEEQMWKWANAVLLFAALGYMMAKFLPPAFAARTAEIQKDIKEAQADKAAADKRAAEMEARLSKLSADIDTFRAGAAVEMQQEGERIRKETASQMKRIEEQAAIEIESAGKAATRELKEYSAELALKLAEQKLLAKLDAATSAGLVEGFIADLAKRQPGKGAQN
jgi:F0F1-type ATP synthase membrane subunit b/b'